MLYLLCTVDKKPKCNIWDLKLAVLSDSVNRNENTIVIANTAEGSVLLVYFLILFCGYEIA